MEAEASYVKEDTELRLGLPGAHLPAATRGSKQALPEDDEKGHGKSKSAYESGSARAVGEDMAGRGLRSIFQERASGAEGCGGSEHAMAYEDKDGDLMLVGDVPWE
ncbi:hypothetical protein OPV22_007477 [Ensete ventricosum]|uniref:Auxin-responsive protein n=1 Tax=Ensete ventricosum TaxID=4639 RepID=A0AAV8Q8P5_ENSVE|nr:hypothetical protein OPV22_007477 [Ensete ventricosum]RZR87411.1 hypothetical protein BHM03_00014821 [Ensete ventricosum]